MARETAAAKKAREAEEAAAAEEKNEVAIPEAGDLMDMSGLDGFTTDEGMIGLEQVDETDIKIPVIQLAQPTSDLVSDEKAKQGQFYNTATEEAVDEMEVVLLQLSKTRVMWPDEFSKGSKPLCRSFDNVKGVGDPGMVCAQCEFKDWDNENNKAPACRQGYNWLGVTLDGSDIFKFTAISSGVKPTKEFLSLYLTKYNKYQLFCYRVRISSEKVKNTQGTFFIPKYEILGAVTAAQAMEFKTMLEGYKVMFEKEIADAMEAGPAEDIVDVEVTSDDKPF